MTKLKIRFSVSDQDEQCESENIHSLIPLLSSNFFNELIHLEQQLLQQAAIQIIENELVNEQVDTKSLSVKVSRITNQKS